MFLVVSNREIKISINVYSLHQREIHKLTYPEKLKLSQTTEIGK
jgi:hypothetical protein